MKISDCTHYPQTPAKPQANHCQDEEPTNTQKFDLRVCLTCGHVGCCDDDPGQHALNHSKQSGHQVMASYPADENSWIWCYKDNDYLKNN